MNPTKNIVDKLIHSRRHLKDNESVNENMETKRINGSVKKLIQNYNRNSKSSMEQQVFYYVRDGMYNRTILPCSDPVQTELVSCKMKPSK